MKRKFILFALLLITSNLFSQSINEADIWYTAERPDYSEIDSYVKELGGNCGSTPEKVAEVVTKNCTSDIEKARAIFDWIAYNIAYDTSYSISTAKGAFQRRKSVCAGYSDLYAQMAKSVGLDVITVAGVGKINMYYKPGANVGGGHAWNIVKLADREIIIDSTWGSGYVNGNTFTRYFQQEWFDVHPAFAIFTHFPAEAEYELLAPFCNETLFYMLPYISDDILYSGIAPTEIYKYFLEHPEDNCVLAHSGLRSANKNGLRFLKIPLGKELEIGKTYEMKLIIPNSAFIKMEQSELTTDENGITTITIKPKQKGSLVLYGSSGSLLKYVVVEKPSVFSKHDFIRCENSVQVRLPKYVDKYENFIQTSFSTGEGFFIANCEVTSGEWIKYCKENNVDIGLFNEGYYENLNSPISKVTPKYAALFCNWKSAKDGFSNYYEINEDTITENKQSSGYRLPTVAEWKTAALKSDSFDSVKSISENSWFIQNSGTNLHSVGQLNQNENKLYDMYGNVSELCSDENGNYFLLGFNIDSTAEEIQNSDVANVTEYIPNSEKEIYSGLRLARNLPTTADEKYLQATKYLEGINVEKNHGLYIYWVSESAKMGQSNGLNVIGCCYLEGDGVEKDLEKGLDFIMQSAEKDNAHALYNLGKFYSEGTYVEQDNNKAFNYMSRSLELGYLKANIALASFYEEGIGCEKNLQEAFRLVSVASDADDIDAKNKLAEYYQDGIGTEVDLQKARLLYMQTAKEGSVLGMNELAECYELGKGVHKSFYYAVNWYEKAESKGNSYASSKLAQFYYLGQWYKRSIPNAIKKLEELTLKTYNDIYKKQLDYYKSVQNLIEAYSYSGKRFLTQLEEGDDAGEFLGLFTSVSNEAEQLQEDSLYNPCIINGLSQDEVQSKIITPMKKINEINISSVDNEQKTNVEKLSGKTLCIILPEEKEKYDSIVENIFTTKSFTKKEYRVNDERYKFDQSLFSWYDNIIILQTTSEKKQQTLDIAFPKIENALSQSKDSLFDIMCFSTNLFTQKESASVKSLQNIFSSSISNGNRPRIICFGNKTDTLQQKINLLFTPEQIEKINVYGTPCAVIGELAIGFRKDKIFMCAKSTKFSTGKSLLLYFDETGWAPEPCLKTSDFMLQSKTLASFVAGKVGTKGSVAKTGKMVMYYTVIK